MAESGRFVTRIHHGDKCMGDVAIFPETRSLPFEQEMELIVTSFSSPSDRCSPLVILHTISKDGVLFKLEPIEFSNLLPDSRELEMVHSMCLEESKTAVIPLARGMEVHLVAMANNKQQWPCFWGFLMTSGLYISCLNMLNQRCLGLVFDLDETLIVANTMSSFDDRIDALGSKIKGETDAQKLSGMSAELKRYMEDRALLKQYVEENHVWDNVADKYVDAQVEMVPPISGGGLPLLRPVIRLQDRNMIFTRIYPNRKYTSVLVRVRPAWEELRSYLTANRRKRFEVFICTASEKEYALEMWRLLDTDAQLINTKELTERVVCVNFHSGSKKSLMNVFTSGNCHPNMAMVIDDRLEVWEDSDQSHVHMVPAFAPYYAPQAETNIPVPILCVARNVACNVRGGFFRDFDDGLSKMMADVVYDSDVSALPQPPAINNYLMVEEDTGPSEEPTNEPTNGSIEVPDGMADAETGMRLHEVTSSQSSSAQAPPLQLAHPSPGVVQANENDDMSQSANESTATIPLIAAPPHSVEQSSPVREEGEVPESELDPDTRRRLLILRHGQDTGSLQESFMDLSHPSSTPLHLTIQPPALAGGWLGAEEDLSPRRLSGLSRVFPEPELPSFGKQRPHGASFFGGSNMLNAEGSAIDRRNVLEEAHLGEEAARSEAMHMGRLPSVSAENEGSVHLSSSSLRDPPMRINTVSNMHNPVSVLRDIAQKCNTRLDFKSLLNTTKELQFSVEVLFGGDKVGEGIGRTKKEAQHKAAENSLKFMASQFISHPTQAMTLLQQAAFTNSCPSDEPAQRWNARDPRFYARFGPPKTDDEMPVASTSGQSKLLVLPNIRELNRGYNPVAALKDHCTMEGINLVFKDSSPSEGPTQGSVCQVEVAGCVIGRGTGWSWEEAKQQAAEEALRRVKALPQLRGTLKRMDPSGSPPLQANKRVRTGELPRGIQRLPPSPRKLSPRRFTKS